MTVCSSGDPKLDAAVNGWLERDKNPKTREEVEDDIANARWDKLRKVMLHRQKFGTAGLRGRMGAGYMCMNDVVVLQTAQGLCSYLKAECSQSQLLAGVVVGYDGRYNSERFAALTARVCACASVRVHMFARVAATPLVSFATRLRGAAAGVMVTASHNPKEDNGYKVYWGNGSQIIAPHDDNVLAEILECLDIPAEHWDVDDIRSHPLVADCQEAVTAEYLRYIRGSLHHDVLQQNRAAALDVVYSAMHGVGYEYVVKAFEVANLKAPISVPEQQRPDPEFPTVAFPNPEEPQCAELAVRLATEVGAKLLLINDPDADRLAVGECDAGTNEWKMFTGNEMGALLCWWLLQQRPAEDGAPLYVLASVVSSKMLRALVKGRGHFVETLTGFKWMGNAAQSLTAEGGAVVFAFEEALGYMCGAAVPDKDGLSAAVQVASLASHLYASGSSLLQQLDALYRQHGYHATHSGYFICHDPTTMQRIFMRIRNYDGPGKYPTKVVMDIESVHDLAAGVKIPDDAEQAHHLRVAGTGLDQDYTSGEMVMFRLAGGPAVTLRSSGTEPKLKYYAELVCSADSRSEQEKMKQKLVKIVDEFVTELLQPQENGLVG